ncbi:hypothetical protein KR018_005060 [Drosophila ironensis]|nr:hypothetical protein KR018_005060 [Drosophila ironensis]
MDLPIVQFTPSEVAGVIDRQRVNKAPGHHAVCNATLKALLSHAILNITSMSSVNYLMGSLIYFPKKWKTSIIIMIPKPGIDHTIPTSYRPIRLLSCLSKLFEKCLLTRIIPYLETCNIIPAHQFGF